MLPTHYSFMAGKVDGMTKRVVFKQIAVAPESLVSGGYTGALIGVYATTNGDNVSGPAFVECWRYYPRGQRVDYDTWQF